MKWVFVCGPYRAVTVWEISRNIERAREAAAQLWSMGIPAYCPHANTSLMDGKASDDFFLEAQRDMLRKCAAVFVCGPTENSSGSVAELRLADKLGIPIFSCYEHLSLWFHGYDVAKKIKAQSEEERFPRDARTGSWSRRSRG